LSFLGGQSCYAQCDTYYRVFFDVLGGVWEGFNWIVHAYCLMTNHDHLLVEVPD